MGGGRQREKEGEERATEIGIGPQDHRVENREGKESLEESLCSK